MRGLLRRLAREEDGVALVMALAIMVIFAVTTTGILEAGTANQRTAVVSDQQREAFAIAQEGLAYAAGMVYGSAANDTTPPAGTQDLPAQADDGSGTYYASSSDGTTWHLVGTGTVGDITRTVTANATPPSSTTVQETGVWNYLYADSTAAHTCSNSWDTIQGGTTVTVPILMRGSLCITGGAHFINPSSSSSLTLAVGGTLTVTGGANVGTSSSKVSEVEIGGTPSSTACTVGNTTTSPGSGVCDGTHSELYSSKVGTTLAVTPSMPTVDFQSDYATQAALPQSGCPSGLFDTDSTLNDSIGNVATKLFEYSYYPTALSFDCKIGSVSKPCTSSVSVCEIKWTQTSTSSSNGTLYVNGTFYFDGSLSVGSGQKIQYTGQGTLYLTGGATFQGGSQMCGIASCTTSWDPDVNGIIMVTRCWANSTGSSLIDPKCVDITGGANVQLGFYTTGNYTIDGGTSNMGPVLSNTFTIGGGSSTLIPFHQFPPGTPLATETVTLPGTPPTDWAG